MRITDIPVTNPDEDKTSIDFLKGTYAFEDLCPVREIMI